MWLGGRQWPGVAAMKGCGETVTNQQGQELLSTEAEDSVVLGAVTKQCLVKTQQTEKT
jgi:hypothetical protein